MKKIIKKLKWVFPIFLFGIVSLITTTKAKALTSDSFYFEWITPKIYVNKYKNGVERSERIQVYHKRSDSEIAYCIEPGIDFSDSATLTGYDYNQSDISGMSIDTWRRITLLAYYGYGYGNHTDSKWYAITQYEIWKANPLGWDTYWADSFHGNNISQFESESAELLNLVNNHYKAPSFANSNNTVVVNDTIVLDDTNNVLGNYEVSTNDNATIKKDGNKLYITPNKVGDITIQLSKNSNRFGKSAFVFVADGVQNLMTAGNIDPYRVTLKIKSIGGKVTINKVDKDTKLSVPQGDATLKGATYGIYKEDGTKVSSITTNDKGIVTSGTLPSQGRYYLQEEIPSQGYELDTDNRYYFVITKDNLYPTVTVYEKVIERHFDLFKVFATDKTGFLIGEPNISFDIYLKSSNKKVARITTNEKGYAEAVLPYGKYIVKQVSSTLNHEKIGDFEITINENTEEPYYHLISNAEIKAKLKVVKIDADSKEVIKMSGIKFKIFDLQNNEYVCQNVTYPNAQKICEFETNENGEFITPYALKSGKYRLEEIDQKIDGYLWNSNSMEFEIGENSELITDNDYGTMVLVKFKNQQVKGKVTINKTGEKLIIKNGSYSYKEVALEGVKFGIYAREDIITKDGEKHYKKNELISTIYTNDEGVAELDNLFLGKYYIKELSVPNDNLVLDNKEYDFELTYKDQYTEVVTKSFDILNKYKKGTLDFTKIDLSTGKPLPNTKIEIYTTKDELIFSGITDANGKIVIDDLPINDYYLIEKEAPKNYKINPERQYFSIKENGEIIKATLEDELIIEVPNTDASFNFLKILIPCTLIVLGVVIITYDKHKKNVKKEK